MLRKVFLALLTISLSIGAFFAVRQWQLVRTPPDRVALDYARAVYARDYAAAWEYVSAEDRQVKSRQAYLAENTSFTGLKQELAHTLASWIQFTETQIQVEDGRATVTTRVKVPNGNQQEVSEILRAAGEEGEPTAAGRPALLDRLEAMYAAGQIEILEGEQTFELVRERNGWRVVMDWTNAVVVTLTAEVSPDLPWEFYPLQEEIRALPGETLTAVYRATNRSNETITGKAKHLFLPEEHKEYFTLIQCFCFIQQTLAPGESVDLTLLFYVDEAIPAGVRQVENKYVFYSLGSFPQE
ncbi:MAG: cytochrome c oxidase assembly protein [Chloroflexi bacterium]|nr:cytochrome c oxidase assembly protein [Chloroflexota bacterium]MCI0576949.1 cytochrome c oxidase assembly protein [Chloroflexota bacterium]MCI0648435.1 cytochrome c oxidase assembly protein [Chloroflexota bacterium]MCI0725775.1 cytochrome c oxidase assembly protein [Chloroflexota bacterium]